MAQVLLLCTLTTKSDEAAYLTAQLEAFGVSVRLIDTSLDSGGRVLDGANKCLAMESAANRALAEASAACAQGSEVVLGIGGGTGGEIILQVLRALPITFPKVLVTTLPFDPRIAVADNSIVLVPTLADINGLNAMLRDTFQNAAAMVAGLTQKSRKGELTDIIPSIGITALGVTDAAVRPLVARLDTQGHESTVFHANGYGGAAYSRFIKAGAFHTLIDLTPHEMTRLHVAGPHVPMRERFSAGSDLPRITLPGGLNFFTLTDIATAKADYRARAHYPHSAYFTHVKLTKEEMVLVTRKLADALNAATGPQHLIIPMGGFSSEDGPGGAIEDPVLRTTFHNVMESVLAPHVNVTVLDDHISAPHVTDAILSALTKDT